MKTKVHFPLLLLALVILGFWGCSSKPEVLKIYNWEAYIDSAVIEDFEVYYSEKIGKPFRVIYDTYETYDSVLPEIRDHHADYDLIGLVGYEVEEMARQKLLLPLDHEKLPSFEVYYPWLIDLEFDKGNTYSVPYSYGTTGIMFNPTHSNVSRDDVKTWGVFWNPKYKGRMLMKGSDNYELFSVAALYLSREELMKKSEKHTYPKLFKNTLVSVLNDFSTQRLKEIAVALKEQKCLIDKYVGDEAKYEMANNNAQYDLGLFWNCDAGVAMNLNSDLEYIIPDEGSSVYIDNWAIPAYAQNVDAAHAFLSFITLKENAKRNMVAMGAPTAVIDAAKEFQAELEANTEFFEGKSPAWKAMYIDAYFPSEETLKRCWIRRYNREHSDIIDKVMNDVKLGKWEE